MKKKCTKNIKRVRLLYVFVLAVLFLSCVTCSIFAKYAVEKRREASVSASAFYFESDILTEDNKEYVLNVDTQTITLYLKNNADSLRISEMDITCSVQAEGLTVQMDKTVLSKESADTITVTLTGFENGGSYVVTAKGVGGYEKTLLATFTVRTYDAGFYKYVDTTNEGYVKLLVWTGGASGSVTVTIPDGVIPDRTEKLLEDVEDTVTFTLEKNASQAMTFIIPNDYTGATPEFLVKLNGSVLAMDALPSN